MSLLGFELRSVFLPTDFSPAGEVAFAHALRLALEAKAELRIMHVGSGGSRWSQFPKVRETLTRWGFLPPGSSRSMIGQLGLQVEKINMKGRDPVTSILQHLERRPSDLIVLATHQRQGPVRWIYKAVAEPIARQAGAMTLFVPPKSKGFVSLQDGSVNLQQIVIPIDHTPLSQLAVDASVWLSQLMKAPRVSYKVIHIAAEGEMPELRLYHGLGRTWTRTIRRGDIVDQILRSADEHATALIVMATQGHKGFLDALRGSTTERVIRKTRSLVLAIQGEPPLD